MLPLLVVAWGLSTAGDWGLQAAHWALMAKYCGLSSFVLQDKGHSALNDEHASSSNYLLPTSLNYNKEEALFRHGR